jgi:hypothetical protein
VGCHQCQGFAGDESTLWGGKLQVLETLLAQLQTEGTPAGGIEDADNDTSDDENPIKTSW